MAVNYSIATINSRLQAVITAIGNNGLLVLRVGTTTLCSIQLANPCGTVDGGVLTFTGPQSETAAASGIVDNAIITDSSGTTIISGLSVGTPLASADIVINNGSNSTEVSAGESVMMVAAQITGS